MKLISFLSLILVATQVSTDSTLDGLLLANRLACFLKHSIMELQASEDDLHPRQGSAKTFRAIGKILPTLVLSTEKLAKECHESSVDADNRNSVDICPDDRNSDAMTQLQYLADVDELADGQLGNAQAMVRNISETLNNIHCVTMGANQQWQTYTGQGQTSVESQLELNDAIGRLRQVMKEVQEAFFLQSYKINNNLNSLGSGVLKSVIGQVLRIINVENRQMDLFEVKTMAEEYFNNPNNDSLANLRETCQGHAPIKLLIQLKRRFSDKKRIVDFYNTLDFSHKTVGGALVFMENLIEHASISRIHCLMVDDRFKNANASDQLSQSFFHASAFQSKVVEISEILHPIRFPTLVNFIAREDVYQKTIDQFVQDNWAMSNAEIADGLKRNLTDKFGFFGVRFLVASLNLNNSDDGDRNVCIEQVKNPQLRDGPWQGSIWKLFSSETRAVYVLWTHCEFDDSHQVHSNVSRSIANETLLTGLVSQLDLASVASFHVSSGHSNLTISNSLIDEAISISNGNGEDENFISSQKWSEEIKSSQYPFPIVNHVSHFAFFTKKCSNLDRLRKLYPNEQNNRCQSGSKCSQLALSSNGHCQLELTPNSIKLLKMGKTGKKTIK